MRCILDKIHPLSPEPAILLAVLLLAVQAPVLQKDGLQFRDLNKNGVLDPYEDRRLTPEQRARDLVARMTLEEKAGTMMHGTVRSTGPNGGVGMGTAYDTAENRKLIDSVKVTNLITRLTADPATIAAQNNALQRIAENTRLGIPITISTDPRNHFQSVVGATVQTNRFSQWPEPLGFGALDDTALTRRFGDIARQEYRAVGIHMALSPQADLATEPRWGRIQGTFGEDAALAERLVRAYVVGFQHGDKGLDTGSVVTVVKHWVGYGAAKDGFDSHTYYGRFASFTGKGNNLDYHIRPFVGAFAAQVGGVMPTYSILQGATWRGQRIEQVGAGYNRQLLTDLLRGAYGYRGIVVTDWAITWDCNERCVNGAPAGQRPSFADLGMPWGVENLTMRGRFVKAVDAGVDEFGGTERAELLVEAVRRGELKEARLDSSVVRILRQKFAQGLFEQPYVDTAAAARIVGSDSFRTAGLDAQRRALVLLENTGGILPLKTPGGAGGAGADYALRVYLHGIAPAAVAREGWTVVDDPKQANIAIMRLDAPFERLHPQYVFGQFLHEGSLAFKDGDPDYELFKRVSAAVPTIVTVNLDRPAILTPIRDRARALIANFGVSDEALIDVLTGRAKPEGKLPFELPSSMEAVAAQRPDMPHDSATPLYPLRFGRSY